MKKLILLLAAVAMFTASCDTRHKHKHVVVHSYKILNDIADSMDDMFMYVISDGNSSYCTTSRTPLTSFSNVQWSRSEKTLEELKEEQNQELEEQQLEVQDLPEDMQTDVADNPGGFEDSPSDSGSDGGSGDSGGGDSGGGDGGGGGD